MSESINITNEDCMDMMARYPDNHFDLAIVDPPYGLGKNLVEGGHGRNAKYQKDYDSVKWDIKPNANYWNELMRVSKNQIVWGGNYFLEYLSNTRCFLIWDKMQTFTGADFEMAWTSFDKSSKAYRLSRIEAYSNGKIHPTQKPFSLYKWLLINYSEQGQSILDTHLGSGSIAIAVDSVNKIEKMNLTLTACEIDKEYYDAAMKRITEQTAWQSIF